MTGLTIVSLVCVMPLVLTGGIFYKNPVTATAVNGLFLRL
jgi:hypothetical protein